jgi:hypothetical protein
MSKVALFTVIYPIHFYFDWISRSLLSSSFTISMCIFMFGALDSNAPRISRKYPKTKVLIESPSLFWSVHSFDQSVATYDKPSF